MNILVLDLETLYSDEYSLRRMSPAEYILDPRFIANGCAIMDGLDGVPYWVDGDYLPDFFRHLNPDTTMTISHNALFDNSILAWRFNFVPRLACCTMSIAQATRRYCLKSVSLSEVAKHLRLGFKDAGALTSVKGMDLPMIRAAGLYNSYVEYALHDVELCAGIFQKLVVDTYEFPMQEIPILDMLLKMTLQPSFVLDRDRLAQHLHSVQVAKQRALDAVGSDKTLIRQNETFADMLRMQGVDPPRKVSPTTGLELYAFAKTDEEFIALESHPNVIVQALVAARLGAKSTIEETRAQRFINISNLQWPVTIRSNSTPMPVNFSGAHTHRASGAWAMNCQNLSRDGELRKALRAPPGYKVITVDASQIEARITAFLANQEDLLQQFERNDDVYSNFASIVYGKPINKKDHPVERFVGKTCLAKGTLVITHKGAVKIENVTTEHLLWDGEEWVCHKGLVLNGWKQTLQLCGVWLTPDHLVWSGEEWLPAELLEQDEGTLYQSLEHAADTLRSPAFYRVPEVDSQRLSLSVTAGGQNTPWIRTILRTLNRLGVVYAQILRELESAIGFTARQCPMINTAPASLIDYLQPLVAVTFPLVEYTNITDNEVLKYTENGTLIGSRFLNIFKHFQVGTVPVWKWIVSTLMETTNRETSGSLPEAKICPTNGRLETLRQRLPVYDLACAGPRNRFTVLTERGPLTVHNCVLGLQYGMGWMKFHKQINLSKVITIDEAQAANIVSTYRTTFNNITALRARLTNAIPILANGGDIMKVGPVIIEKGLIHLPGRLRMFYHELQHKDGEWVFTFANKPKRLFNGRVLENIVQYLDRIIVFDAAIRIEHRFKALGWDYHLAQQAHDENGYVVKDEHVEQVKEILLEEMTRRPSWGATLPLMAEVGVGDNYGEAK